LHAFYVSHTLFFFGGVLLLPATIELVRLLRDSHPKAAFWGGVLSLMGFIVWGALDGMDFVTYGAGSAPGWTRTQCKRTSTTRWRAPPS
jgi:hypothetical protein